MKKKVLLAIASVVLATNLLGQNAKEGFANTIEVTSSDSKESIIQKAAHVVPTPNQLGALQNEFIAFIHMGPNTFTRMEWGNGMEDPAIFDLKELDTDQWCEAMKAAGMKMAMITVKHHDGFCLWQSRYTKHGIMSTGFRDGKGDILKDLSESCRKYGLKLGIYLSPADLYQIENPEGLYGNLSKYTKRTIPREVSGRPFKNKMKFEFEIDDYNEYFLNQLFELLTEYGPVHEVWFDGAHPKTKGGQKYNYPAWEKLIRTLAPETVIFGRKDLRWCGNESGGTRQTEWNVLPFSTDPNTIASFPDLTANDLGSRELLYDAKFLHYMQAETNTSIREGWFYRDDTHQKVRSTDDVFDIYERTVGGNSTFLLNIPPNREGKFSPADVKVLKETGERIKETYGTNLLAGAQGPKEVLDSKMDTYLTPKGDIVISTKLPITFNRLLLQEAIQAKGERVEKHIVEAWIDNNWKEVAHGTNIGYKRILRFPEVTTNKIRIRFTEVRDVPAISNITAHYYQSRPPQLTSQRSMDGMLTIKPLQQEFNWKAHGEDISQNLNAGFKIYYTTDGTAPSENSTLYTAPFMMNNGKLKAVAILNTQKGAVYEEQTGLIKKGWKLSSEGPHFISIDLGQAESLSGFAYTPQKSDSKGMVAKGTIQISNDGQNWEKLEDFEFGNLINDPTKRYHYFKQPAKARYVSIRANEIAANGEVATIAEIDLF